MKKYSILLSCILFCSCVGYGQDLSPLHFDKNGHVINAPIDTSIYKGKPIIIYGLSGIKSEPIDTQKLYFHKFIFFTELMNKSTGRRSARFQDSAEFYYKKLYKSK